MNLRHVRSVTGTLRIISIAVGILAALIGTTSYYLSNYNRNCHGLLDSFPPHPRNSVSTTVSNNLMVAIQQEATTDNSGTDDEIKDMAPVLWMERFSISVVWIGTTMSIILLITCLLFQSLDYSKIFKSFNFLFHFLWTVFLIVSAIFVGYSAYEIQKQVCRVREFGEGEECQKYILKMCAATFNILMGLTYGAICCSILGTKMYYTV